MYGDVLMKSKWLIIAAAASLSLTACGGGGGSSDDGSTNTVTATLVGTGGTISPLGAQKIGWGEDAVFTITPDAHMSAKASTNCSSTNYYSSFSNSGTTFTQRNIYQDCTITFSFETIQHTVTAKVVDGMLVPMSPDAVAGQADFVALDKANNALYAADENGATSTIQAYTLDSNGALTANGSAMSAPYLDPNCDSSASGNSAPGHCLLVGKSGNAANHVYAILNPVSGPVIRVYTATAGGLTQVADVDPDKNLVDVASSNAITILDIGAIAIDGAHNRLFAAVKAEDNSSEYSAVLSYDIGSDGTFTVNQGTLASSSNQQLNGLVVDSTGSNLYITYDKPSQSSTVSDQAGIIHLSVDASSGAIDSSWNSSYRNLDKMKTQSFALVPGTSTAYYTYSYDNGAPFHDTGIVIAGYAIDGNGDLSGSQALLSSGTFSNIKQVTIHVADNGKTAYLQEDASNSSTSSSLAIYSIDSSTGGLSFATNAVTFANNSAHGMAIDYSNGLAYLADPANNKINQYWVGTDKGTVSPPSQTVNDGSTASVTLTSSDPSYQGAASGCNGALSADTYSASNVLANCAIVATFVKQ